MHAFAIASFCALCALTAATCPTEPGFTGTTVLDAGVNYQVSWKIDGQFLVLKLAANVEGWLGFGFGEQTSGSMLGADIVTAHVDASGVVTAEDRFVKWAASPLKTSPMPFPTLDGCNDWEALSGDQTSGRTTVVMRRRLVTGDAQDRNIMASGSQRIIYAWGTTSDVVSYHNANRGSGTLDFSLATLPAFQAPADATSTVDLKIGSYTMLSGVTTQYVCQSFDVNDLIGSAKKNIVAFQLLIDQKAHVHHMLLHGCGTAGSIPYPVNQHYPNHAICQNDIVNADDYGSSPLFTGPCTELMLGWAMGGSDVVLPANVGKLISTVDLRWLILEIHYDNPNHVSGVVDNSGLRLHLTTDESSRLYQSGTLTLGDLTTGLPDLPKGSATVVRETTCPSSCTTALTGTVNVFASFLHMHTVGRQIYTVKKSISTGAKTVVNRIDYWNFMYQQTTPVQYSIEPGDSLNVHGIYDTSKQAAVTKFGSPSSSEMLFDFLFVWPKSNLGGLYNCGYYAGKTMCNVDKVYGSAGSNPAADGYGAMTPALEVLNATCKASYPLASANCAPATTTTTTAAAATGSTTTTTTTTKTTTPTTSTPTTSTTSTKTCMLNIIGNSVVYDFCTTLDLPVPFDLYWNALSGTTLEMAVQVGVTSGWAGIGIPTTPGLMTGAAIIASHAPLELKAYSLVQEVSATQNDAAVAIGDYSVQSDGILTFSATLTGITSSTVDIIYATGPWSSGANVPLQHDYHGSGSVSLGSGASTSAATGSKLIMKTAHGWIMIVAWGFLLPMGMFLPRFFKEATKQWFYVHVGCQVVGFIAACVGTGLGFAVYNGQVPAHRGIGLAVMVSGFLVLLAGLLRPAHESPHRANWALFHFWLARAALALAVANIYVGIYNAPTLIVNHNLYTIIYSCGLGLLVVAFVILTTRSKKPAKSVPATKPSHVLNPAYEDGFRQIRVESFGVKESRTSEVVS